jgi:hypothetical protein
MARMGPGVTALGDGVADVHVLLVGAGPTGLALAAQLERFGASFRSSRAAWRARRSSTPMRPSDGQWGLLVALGIYMAVAGRG